MIRRLTLIAALASLTACTTPTTTTPSPSAPSLSSLSRPNPTVLDLPDVDAVDRSDPDAVSRAVVETWFAVDTTIDRGPSDGLARAAILLTPAYARAVRGHADLASATDADWREWADHRVWTNVTVDPVDEPRPADTTAQAHRAWSVTTTPTSRDGWRGQPHHTVALMALVRDPAGWSVDRIDLR